MATPEQVAAARKELARRELEKRKSAQSTETDLRKYDLAVASDNKEYLAEFRKKAFSEDTEIAPAFPTRLAMGPIEPEDRVSAAQRMLPEGFTARALPDEEGNPFAEAIFDKAGKLYQVTNKPGLNIGDVAEAGFDVAGGTVEGLASTIGGRIGLAAPVPPLAKPFTAAAGAMGGASVAGGAVELARQGISPGPVEWDEVRNQAALSGASEAVVWGGLAGLKGISRHFKRYRTADDLVRKTVKEVGPDVEADLVGRKLGLFHDKRIFELRKGVDEEVRPLLEEVRTSGRKIEVSPQETLKVLQDLRPKDIPGLDIKDLKETFGMGPKPKPKKAPKPQKAPKPREAWEKLLEPDPPPTSVTPAPAEPVRKRPTSFVDLVDALDNVDALADKAKTPRAKEAAKRLRAAIAADIDATAASSTMGADLAGKLKKASETLKTGMAQEQALQREMLHDVLTGVLSKGQAPGAGTALENVERGGFNAISILASDATDNLAVAKAMRIVEKSDPSLASEVKRAVLNKMFPEGAQHISETSLKKAKALLKEDSTDYIALLETKNLMDLHAKSGDGSWMRTAAKGLRLNRMSNAVAAVLSKPPGVLITEESAPTVLAMVRRAMAQDWEVADKLALKILKNKTRTLARESTARGVEGIMEAFSDE